MPQTKLPLATALWLVAAVAASALEPFGSGLKLPARDVKPVSKTAYRNDLACLAPPLAAKWTVENPAAEAPQPFTLAARDGRPALALAAGAMTPARTTVRLLLPGDAAANGAVWAKNQANYISFQCQTNRPVQMTCQLLQRGKSAGTWQAGFSLAPGGWQEVVLPLPEFGMKSFGQIAGVGFRTAAAPAGAEVAIASIAIGTMPFNEDSWKTHRLAISLLGDWRFAADPGDQGLTRKWYADDFDDSAWATLKSGQSWQEQGIDLYGYGWYRQQVYLPKEFAGVPLTLDLTTIAADDDAWCNGTRVGGWHSEYKYNNHLPRAYTIPPALLRYGATNTIAIRIWGGFLGFIGNKSGLTKGPLVAALDPYRVGLRAPGGETVPAELFDLSDARQGQPFEIVFSFPAALGTNAQLRYRIGDYLGHDILAGQVPLVAGPEGRLQAAVAAGREAAQAVYLRGRLRCSLLVTDAAGTPLCALTRFVDRLAFTKRDETALPALPEQFEDTPCGRLRLIDDIDCAASLYDDPHPYLQGGFEHIQDRVTPGSPVGVRVADILGRQARECDYGWFAYRIGRGKLRPHSTYLVRIEYPEDKPRFAPIEIQTGQNYMDVGWRNGVAPNDVYDPWPLSNSWQWYDVIVPLDDQTVGTGGTGSAPAENGLWLYFLNKLKPGAYYAMWSGGPAVARIKLYELDPEKNAPVIRLPQGLPQRLLAFDWERQPDHDPADFCRYARLMGYNAISPVIIKWFFANYSNPLNGYGSVAIDAHDYWARKDYDPASGQPAASPLPGRPSQHNRYLEATKTWGLKYLPRVEWGGSQDLPNQARAIDVNGQPTKPNRFAPWCSNLLHPATWDDLQKLMDHLVKPYAQDYPQLAGVLWRIRCNRLPISYGRADVELFCRETGTALPPGGEAQWTAWAAGDAKVQYDDWWHRKRAAFHIRLAKLLQSYRPDLALYYYNWDEDKFGLIEPDITAWGFVANVVKPAPEGGRAAYEKERQVRAGFTAQDYLAVMRSGNFGKASKGVNRADYGIRPELYRGTPGIQLFAPANYLCYADKPEYLNYFRTDDGLAVSNVVSYDEIGARSINPKYEGNMITPAGPAFSMALELLAWFHGDARTLNYTVYTYGRGFAAAHRRFAQAFLALPALPGTVVEQGDAELKVRVYPSPNGTYVGVGYRGMGVNAKKFSIRLPGLKPGTGLEDLVTGKTIATAPDGDGLRFDLESGPMALHAFLLR